MQLLLTEFRPHKAVQICGFYKQLEIFDSCVNHYIFEKDAFLRKMLQNFFYDLEDIKFRKCVSYR